MSERLSTSLEGKVALVTGGARGLGAATARSLTAAGARVYVVDLRHPAAGGLDGTITSLVGDVTDLEDMTRTVEAVVSEAGQVDIVVANAGVVARGATLRAAGRPMVDRLFDVNVGGALNTNFGAISTSLK